MPLLSKKSHIEVLIGVKEEVETLVVFINETRRVGTGCNKSGHTSDKC